DDEFGGVLGVELLAQTGGDGLLDVVVDLLALDVLVSSDAIDDADEFLLIHKMHSLFSCGNFFALQSGRCKRTPKQNGQPESAARVSKRPVQTHAPATRRFSG